MRYFINPKYQKKLYQQGISNIDEFQTLATGEVVTRGSTVRVWKNTLEDFSVYVKKYFYDPPSWRYFARKSKAQKEFESYALFEKWQIPCPEIIGYAEKRSWGRPAWAIIVTKEVENTSDLKKFFPTVAENSEIRIATMKRLGKCLATMHSYNFRHRTFRFRNILIKKDSENPQLFLIDCPSHQMVHYFPNLKFSDLAYFYQEAEKFCTELEWQAFLQEYCKILGFNPAKLHKILKKRAIYRPYPLNLH